MEALFRDLLIGVTSFFRDPEAFKALEEQIIPKLFTLKPASAVIRVWSPGCSTGEEAYSIAILLQECMEAQKQSYTVQVFATDIDGQAIAAARVGLYPASIAADITRERLGRFFTAEPDGSAYRVHKGIRDMLVFSEQDVIKDPPFSKLDLISCRNLLIYMGVELQKKIIPLFHYALNPGGFLFLGTSETVGEFGDLFAALDRKSKTYQHKEDLHRAQRAALGRFLPPMTAMDAALPRAAGKTAGPGKLPLRELTEQALLQQVAPAQLAEKYDDRHVRNKIEGVNRSRGEAAETVHHLYMAYLRATDPRRRTRSTAPDIKSASGCSTVWNARWRSSCRSPTAAGHNRPCGRMATLTMPAPWAFLTPEP